MANDGTYAAKEIAEIMGVSKQAIIKRVEKESWSYLEATGRGGKVRKYPLSALPADIQSAIVAHHNNKDATPAAIAEMLPALAPAAAETALAAIIPHDIGLPSMMEAFCAPSAWSPETAVSEADLGNPRIRNILAIIREAEAVPRTWTKGKRGWIDIVAKRHEVTFQSVYRWMAKYEKKGIAGLRHTKSYRDQPKKWTPEAVDFLISAAFKREHRDMDRKDIYDKVAVEAQRRGWSIGGYESALWWVEKKGNPLLEAMQKGGLRALDNLLPSILRDYTDLMPFEIIVGDQHRFDRWVMDEETGQVFRPEGYLWQDLRTRIIYGAAVDKKYDAWLIGLALRVGISCYGAFGSIYTDNGKPELSKFVTGILANMRGLGMGWERTDEAVMDLLDVDAEDIHPSYTVPGTHRKAVVKNAKAKMIEGTFYRIERVMASVLRLAGQTKRMGDDIHWQDVDQQEAAKLAKDGRLLTSREFALAMYAACDHCNRIKTHRGVLSEWAWLPRPKEATPLDCLMAVYNNDNWRPRMISPDAADLLFLARADRVVNKGRINFAGDFFEHDALLELHGERVGLRYNPMTLDELHIFQGGNYLCTARPVERSSMKDMDLASRKIAEKRERRKKFAEEFRKISAIAPDFRQYSTVPRAERVAALIGSDRARLAIENKELTKPVTQEEIDAHIAKMEQNLPLPAKAKRPLPVRPGYFLDDFSRFEWIMDYLKAGGDLDAADDEFKTAYLQGLDPMQRDYYDFELAEGGNQ